MNTLARSVASALLLSSLATSTHASLISNPSFEAGLTDWFMQCADPNATFGLATNFAHTGSNSAFYGQSNISYIGLKQNIALPVGDYQLSFWIYNLGVGNDTLTGFIDYQQSNDPFEIFPGSIVSTGLESWEQVSLTIHVLQPAVQLRFTGFDNNAIFYLDDFELSAVPAPTAFAPLALGGLLLTRCRR